MKTLKIEIKKNSKGIFRFSIIASNGKSIATATGYNTKQACKKSIASLMVKLSTAEIIDCTKKK